MLSLSGRLSVTETAVHAEPDPVLFGYMITNFAIWIEDGCVISNDIEEVFDREARRNLTLSINELTAAGYARQAEAWTAHVKK